MSVRVVTEIYCCGTDPGHNLSTVSLCLCGASVHRDWVMSLANFSKGSIVYH